MNLIAQAKRGILLKMWQYLILCSVLTIQCTDHRINEAFLLNLRIAPRWAVFQQYIYIQINKIKVFMLHHFKYCDKSESVTNWQLPPLYWWELVWQHHLIMTIFKLFLCFSFTDCVKINKMEIYFPIKKDFILFWQSVEWNYLQNTKSVFTTTVHSCVKSGLVGFWNRPLLHVGSTHGGRYSELLQTILWCYCDKAEIFIAPIYHKTRGHSFWKPAIGHVSIQKQSLTLWNRCTSYHREQLQINTLEKF